MGGKHRIICSVLAEVRLAGRGGYSVRTTFRGAVEDAAEPLFEGDKEDCEGFVRTYPRADMNRLVWQNRSLAVVTPEGRVI